MSKSKKVVFFGSGPVAAASLALLASDFTIEAIITKPKPPHHRGEVPVLEVAKKLELPVFTAANKQELDELFAQKPVNSHFSILPQWRGADPITFAVLSGQQTTGVSLMLLVEAMDEGPLLAYGEHEMPANTTTPELTNELIKLSHALLVETVPKYRAGELQPVAQNETGCEVSYSRKLVKSDGVVDFSKSARQIEREVRAYQPWPKSQAKILGHDVIITKTRVAKDKGDGDLVMKCQPGWLEIQKLIAPSGRTMSGADFLRGYKR